MLLELAACDGSRSWLSKVVVGFGLEGGRRKLVVRVDRRKWFPDLAIGGSRRSWPSKMVAKVGH